MNVKVCDAICGAGKTQACIHYINISTDKKFIFITPYLDEVERIKKSCKGRGFISPERNFSNGWSKLNEIHNLLARGENIASTHSLFSNYTDETKELIRSQGYTLILDEAIELFEPLSIAPEEVELLKDNSIISCDENQRVSWNDKKYKGEFFAEIKKNSQSHQLIEFENSFSFWSLPIDVFECFSEVYVLTYLFEYQVLKYFFDAHKIRYEMIGTKKNGDEYNFCSLEEMDRRRDIEDKIHILQDDKKNEVGTGRYTLSNSWFQKTRGDPSNKKIEELQNNIYNIFRKFGGGSADRLWTTYKSYQHDLRGKGYSNGFLAYNARASNEYANRKYLAYCVNVFMRPWVKNYLLSIGVKEVNEDMYALSILIQWVFRSAIRKNEDVWIYIPSERMRFLLAKWLSNLKAGEDLKPIILKEKKKIQESVKLSRISKLRRKKQKKGNEKNVNL